MRPGKTRQLPRRCRRAACRDVKRSAPILERCNLLEGACTAGKKALSILMTSE